MKYLILEQRHNTMITGGQAVNARLYNHIIESGNELEYSSLISNSSSNLGFLINSLMNVRKFSKYDKIIIDSSSFPKTVWFVLLFSLLYGKGKLTGILHHFIHEGLGGVKKTVYRCLEILFVRHCGEILVFSPYVYNRCQEYVDEKRISFLGLPFKKGVQQPASKQYGKLLYVGTVEHRKGLVYLIEALNSVDRDVLKGVELNVVGKPVDDKYLSDVQRRVREYGLEGVVFFRGRVDDDELKRFYEESMIFVFPSLLEGFGIVLIEAMGYGLPVVAFNNSAMPYTVETGKNGVIVPNKDSVAFGRGITELLQSPDLYTKLSAGARDTYEKAKSEEEFDHDFMKVIKRWSAQ